MMPVEISNATRVLAKDQDEYMSLHICDQIVDGNNHMVSVWEPSDEELEVLANGGSIRLSIIGNVHPPVKVGVQSMER